MKRIVLIVLSILLSSTVTLASPFLICDPQIGVTNYKLTGPAWVPATVTAQSDGSIKMDVSGSTVGNNSLTVAACKTDVVWGEQCSVFVPFTFTRPSGAVVPSGIKLNKE